MYESGDYIFRMNESGDYIFSCDYIKTCQLNGWFTESKEKN
jgi:hypothetical protein